MNPTRVARNLSTGAVTMIAAWSSWSHMVHVALKFGERPEVAYVLPISVDGMLVVASTAMVEDKLAGRSVRWSARVAFAVGVAASVAANIAAAHPTVGARTVAAWPALAMLLVVEILSRARPAPYREDPKTGSSGDEGRLGGTGPVVPVLADSGPTGDDTAVQRSDLDQVATDDDHPSAVNAMQRPRSRVGRAVDTVVRLRAERPDASLADIAAEAGVSERHVRRLLTSRT
ncbi:MAG: hypothetical protein AUI14_06895 [Actinobacteria bacterium 13_2_20CM_2_71_6]|nr:MAG: hypothetical protein AUI14_06895 [Actinobacteria bacterium 13_2_20CM_2_71_6]